MAPASKHRPVQQRSASPQQQRGVAAIFAAVSLVTLLTAVTLGIDVGRLYNAQRSLQRLADLAAIDGARVRSQCLGAADAGDVQAEVTSSLLRNAAAGDISNLVRLGNRQQVVGGSQTFVAAAAGTTTGTDSVQVTLKRPSPARILPLFTGPDALTLTARAAAIGDYIVTARIGSPTANSLSGNFVPGLVQNALAARVGVGGSSGAAGVSTEVNVSDLINASGSTTVPLPDLQTPVPVNGLLSDLSALLNQTGDSAGAALVDAYAAATDAARPGGTVVPAQVLGLPLSGSYDGATASLGDILNSVAGAVTAGDPIQLGGLCDVVAGLGIDLDGLPTAAILPALCDSTVTARITQPSRVSSFNSSSNVLDLSTSNDDVGGSTGGIVQVRLKLVDPFTGKPIELKLNGELSGSRAAVSAFSCARLGQDKDVINVVAQGPSARFAIGDSDSFSRGFDAGDLSVQNLLDDTRPIPLLSVSVGDLLTRSGLGAGLLGSTLNSALSGQLVTVSARVAPVVIGDDRTVDLCMQGPPFPVSQQCNGAPALVGGASSQQLAENLGTTLGNVKLSVKLPDALPAVLVPTMQQASDLLTQQLTAQLQPLLRQLAATLVQRLNSVDLLVGQSEVTLYMSSDKSKQQPKVYAQ